MDIVVDSEVVAIDENGWASFNLLQHHRSKAHLHHYVFDVPIYHGRSVLQVPLEKRRGLLEEALEKIDYPVIFPGHSTPSRRISFARLRNCSSKGSSQSGRAPAIWGGRSGAWVKYKLNQCQEFVIGGYTPGNPFDALIVGCYEGYDLKFVAKVRNGFVPHVRGEVYRRLRVLEIEKCPVSNLPEKRRTWWALTATEMEKCQWLKPNVVAQVDFREWTPDGHLRHPSFVGLRNDRDARAVTIN